MGHEDDFAGAGPEEVVGDAVAGAEVVDADQVVGAAFGEVDDVPVQQDDRSLAVLKHF